MTGTWQVGPAESMWESGVEHAALTPDGKSLLVVGARKADADVLLFNLQQPDPPVRLIGHAPSTWVTVSPDGRFFASGNWKGQGVRVWDLRSAKVIQELPLSDNVNVAFSPDGQWLLTGSPIEYRFWNVHSWQPGHRLAREQAGDYMGAMTFAPDGMMLAVVRRRDTEVKLIAMPNGLEVATLEAGIPLCFSADSLRLATLGEDQKTLLLWDLRLIRQQLAAMNLDWELPPLGAAPSKPIPKPLRLTVLNASGP